MLCDILKPFPFSRDGVNSEMATAGGQCDIPDALVPGLTREGFLRQSGGVAAPENKMVAAAPEVGAPVILTDREIHADLEALGADFDPRDDLAAKTTLRDEARAARVDGKPGGKAKKA